MPYKAPPDLSRFLLSPMPGLLVEVAVEAGQEVKAGRAAGRDRGDEDAEHHRRRARRRGLAHLATPGESLAVDEVILEFAASEVAA